MVSWELVTTFAYALVIASAITGTATYLLLYWYRNPSADRGVRPELAGFECEDPTSREWAFRIRNAGEGTVSHVTVTAVELNRRGNSVNRVTTAFDEPWEPGESITVRHQVQHDDSSAIELRIDCSGPNDASIRFRRTGMGELALDSVETTVFA